VTNKCDPILRHFGRDLRRWLYSKRGAWPILPETYSTWLEGGCWLLARALHEWIGPASELWAIYSWMDSDFHAGKMPQHVVVKVGDCYLDGDGASSKEQLLYRWYAEEGLQEPELFPVNVEELEAVDIPCPIGPMKDLRKALFEKFGPGDRLVR
jgi:hypothetical protein